MRGQEDRLSKKRYIYSAKEKKHISEMSFAEKKGGHTRGPSQRLLERKESFLPVLVSGDGERGWQLLTLGRNLRRRWAALGCASIGSNTFASGKGDGRNPTSPLRILRKKEEVNVFKRKRGGGGLTSQRIRLPQKRL